MGRLIEQKHVLIGALVLVAVVGAVLFLLVDRQPASAPLRQTYRNDTYGFSLRLPADYTVTEAPNTNPTGGSGPAR